MPRVEPITIETLDEPHPLRARALRMLLREPMAAGLATEHVGGDPADAQPYARFRSATVVGASSGVRLLSSAMLSECPGRLGVVYVPPEAPDDERFKAMVLLLKALPPMAWARDLCMLQTLLTPDAHRLAEAFSAAGFRFLAELLYLQRRPEDPCPAARREAAECLEFVTYTPARKPLFLKVLEMTYQDSLDCPALAGARRTEDVLESHRAAGVFEPDLWMVAVDQQQPVGVMLLSGAPDGQSHEVVYMGVVPAARGRGVANALLREAARLCRRGSSALTLAVDNGNVPALRLYRRWCFQEFARRRAWFCLSPTCSQAR